jgi:phosphoglycerate dehydrogenase-like enzyme
MVAESPRSQSGAGGLALVLSPVVPDIDVERTVLAAHGIDVELASHSSQILDRQLQQADGLLVAEAPRIDAELLARAPRCKVVVAYGVGYDNIDLVAAAEHGVVVANVPDYCTGEVADHTLMLLLALQRRVLSADHMVRSGEWGVEHLGPVHRLQGRTLGIIGLGRIGRAVALRAMAFGLRVIAFESSSREQPEGVSMCSSLDELLRTADIVTAHVPLTPSTIGMLDAAAIARMKPGALLINLSRGRVVDEAALLDALESGKLAGAALDVFGEEPPTDSGLIQRADVVLTPHVGFYSLEAIEESRTRAALAIAAALAGATVPNRVI